VDFFMIRSFLETGEWRRAADACRDWIKARSGGSDVHEALVHTMYAEALRNLKDFKSALNHLDRAAKMQGNEIQIQYERLLVAWEGGNWQALNNTLGRIRTLKGDQALIKRFTLFYKIKTGTDDREILSLLQEAVRTLGPEPELMYDLGERYLKMGLIPESLGWFRKTRQVQESHERAWLGEIAALEVLSETPPGAAVTAANTHPGIQAAGERLRKMRAAEQRATVQWTTELGAAYDRYVQRWPDNYSIRRDRALYLIHTFEYEEAVKELETLLPWEPSNPSLRRVLAYGYRKTARYREAAVFLKSLLKEKPRDIELLLEYSGCLERAGAAVYAAAVLEKAMPLFTASAEVPLALGILRYRGKKLEKAFDYLREAASRAPKDPRPWQWMAVIARNNGEAESAHRYEYEAKKRKPQAAH
jgi:tetratricopeptide (TPR) repeat protein